LGYIRTIFAEKWRRRKEEKFRPAFSVELVCGLWILFGCLITVAEDKGRGKARQGEVEEWRAEKKKKRPHPDIWEREREKIS